MSSFWRTNQVLLLIRPFIKIVLFIDFDIKDGQKQGKRLSMLCFLVYRNVKMKLRQKDFAVYEEDIVDNWIYQKWFTRFYAQDFLLNDVPLLNRPVRVDRNQSRHCLRMINVLCYRKHSTCSKYLNQTTKIICTILVMLVTLMCGFHVN